MDPSPYISSIALICSKEYNNITGGDISRRSNKRGPHKSSQALIISTTTMRVLLVLLLLSIMSSSSLFFHGRTINAKKPPLLGGSHPIKNLKDPHILEIANFAVSEHNKESKSNLIFQRLVGGKIGVVEGLEYHLIIEAKDGTTKLQISSCYEAVVWEREWLNFRQLTSFKKLLNKKKPVLLSAWKPVENLEKDMHILEIARYAVLEHNKDVHDHHHVLVFEKVVSGETQLQVPVEDHDQGVIKYYRLVISAMDGARYEALVWEKAWLKSRRLTSFKPLP